MTGLSSTDGGWVANGGGWSTDVSWSVGQPQQLPTRQCHIEGQAYRSPPAFFLVGTLDSPAPSHGAHALVLTARCSKGPCGALGPQVGQWGAARAQRRSVHQKWPPPFWGGVAWGQWRRRALPGPLPCTFSAYDRDSVQRERRHSFGNSGQRYFPPNGGGARGVLEWPYTARGGGDPPPGRPQTPGQSGVGKKTKFSTGKLGGGNFGTQTVGSHHHHHPPSHLLHLLVHRVVEHPNQEGDTCI